VTASKSSSGGSGPAGRSTRPGASRPGPAALAEQLTTWMFDPFGFLLLTRERIQATFDEAVERGRLTRTDANRLVAELVDLGCQQTEELLGDIDHLLDRGREQLESAGRRTRVADGMERLARTADRARGTVGAGPSVPIAGYDELTAGQVQKRLRGLTPADLRRVREYERRHANRKSVLSAVERALA